MTAESKDVPVHNPVWEDLLPLAGYIMKHIESVPGWADDSALITARAHAYVLHHDLPAFTDDILRLSPAPAEGMGDAVEAEVDRIMALSDEEIIAEVTAEGGDPEAIVAEARERIAETLERSPRQQGTSCPYYPSASPSPLSGEVVEALREARDLLMERIARVGHIFDDIRSEARSLLHKGDGLGKEEGDGLPSSPSGDPCECTFDSCGKWVKPSPDGGGLDCASCGARFHDFPKDVTNPSPTANAEQVQP